MGKRLLKNIADKALASRWNIGFIDFDPNNFLKQDELKIYWMKHTYKDRWFADPFILSVHDNTIELLVEEYYDPIRRGRIAKLTVDAYNFTLLDNQVVLELDSHLSYPAILEINGEIYVYPENSEAGCLVLYKYDADACKLISVSVLNDKPLTDATITKLFSKSYMFSTQMPNPNNNELGVYLSEQLTGNYILKDTILFQDNTARCAGDFFQIENKLYRSAQNCNNGYGKGLVIQEVSSQEGKFSFVEKQCFYPNSWKWSLGLHTFNVNNKIAVVDGHGYRKPLIGHIVGYIYNLFSKK